MPDSPTPADARTVPPTTAPGLTWTFAYGLPAWLVVVHALIAWFARAPGLLTRQDDTRYLVLAESLRHGQFRDFLWPGAPAHHLYPPGYPALLAVWTAIGGDGFDWLVVSQILISVTTLVLTFDVTRRVMPATVALLSLAMLAVNPHLVKWAGQIASEGALGLCYLLAVWGSVALPRGPRQVTVVLLAAIVAPLMRAAGVVLPAALFVYWLSERRYRDAALVAVVAVLVLAPLVLWTMRDPYAVVGSSYAADIQETATGRAGLLRSVLRRVPQNVSFYVTRGIPWSLSVPTISGSVVDNVAWIGLISTGLVAGMIAGFARFRLGVLSTLATGTLLALWLFCTDRFLVPLLALLVPIMLLGLTQLPVLRRGVVGSVLAALVAVLIIGQNLRLDAQKIATMSQCDRSQGLPDARCIGPAQRGFFEAVRFVQDSLPAEAVIVSAKSEPLFHYTRHMTVPLQRFTATPDSLFWRMMSDEHAEYVLLGRLQVFEGRVLGPRLLRRCETLRVVAAFSSDTYLFGTTPATESAQHASVGSAPGACDVLRQYMSTAGRPVG